MWLVVLFDLPTTSRRDKNNYTLFRNFLKKDGFSMLQYSVYARSCPSEENMEVHIGRIKGRLPPEGQVRILSFTDKQFGRQKIFFGKKPLATEKAPAQLEFF